MNSPLTNDLQGEGFAFFRWHVLEFPHSECSGLNDPLNDCDRWWECQQREAVSALLQTQETK